MAAELRDINTCLMTANKYGTFLTVLLVILIIAILVGGGFLIYNYVIMINMINSNLTDYLFNVNNLRNLTRYQAAPRVSSESVAEHSFFVAAYVLKLHDYYDFNLEKALRMALLHDFNEVFISDVPFPIKTKYKGLNRELEKAEYEVNSSMISKEFADEMLEFNNMSSPEGIIVELGDVLSVVSYSKHEIGLGNSSYMRDVYNKSIPRYTRILTKAEKYLREGKTTDMILNEIGNFMEM